MDSYKDDLIPANERTAATPCLDCGARPAETQHLASLLGGRCEECAAALIVEARTATYARAVVRRMVREGVQRCL